MILKKESTDREVEGSLAHRFVGTRLSLIEFAAHHTLDELLICALDEVGSFVASPLGFYHFVDADQKNISLQQWSTRTQEEFCQAEGKGMHYDIDQAGVWVDCVHEKKPVIHNDYPSLPHKKGMPEGHAEVIRELVVPVMRNDKVVAILGVGNKPTAYTQKDVEIVSYFADVTWEIVQQKWAEEALRESEERFRELADSIADVFFAMDENLRYTYWNRASERLTGIPAQDAIGKSLYDLFPDTLETRNAEKVYRDVLETRQSQTFINVYPVSDEDRFFEISVYPARYGLSVFVKDITERRLAEKRAEEEKSRLASIVEYSSDAIIGVGLDDRILTWNSGAAQLFGHSAEVAKGKPISTLIAFEHPEQLSVSLAKIREGEAAVHLHRMRVMRGHEPVYVSATLSPIKGVAGQLIGISLIGRDVSEGVRTQQAQDREMRIWEGFSNPVRAVVTSEAFGLAPFEQKESQAFAQLVKRYEQTLEHAWERRLYRGVNYPISDELQAIAENLGHIRAGPRDVVRLHITALKNKGQGNPIPKVQAYTEEGRLLIVELMGYLISYYRSCFLVVDQTHEADEL